MKKYDLERMKIYYDKYGFKYKEFKNFYIIFGSHKSFKQRCELNFIDDIKSIIRGVAEILGGLIGIIGYPIVYIFNFIPQIRLKEKINENK